MDIGEDDFAREIRKDFYQQRYLDKFKIKDERADISAIIPTFNRCPFNKKSDNYEYNPLTVAIRSLLLQKSPIREIVIIDDNSNDNTLAVVKELEKEAYSTKGVEIRYIKNKETLGSSVSRNIGAKQAKGKYLFFLDDDCVPAPYLTFISMLVMKDLEKKDKMCSVLVLPDYDRSSQPKNALSLESMGKTFLKAGPDNVKFNAFISDYVKIKDKFLNAELKILKPLRVYQTWGHFIIDRTKYLDVGGFPDFATWPNKAGEEQEFASRLVENAYTLYYLPDPKASSYHGAFGGKRGLFIGVDWLAELTNEKLSLVRFSSICNEGDRSGNRVGVDEFIYSKIIAIFCITYKRNIKESINWAKKSYQDFVVDARKSWFSNYPDEIIVDRRKREGIWHNAIEDGLNLMLKTEKEKINKLAHFIESLKVKGRIEEEERKTRLKEILDMIYNE